MNGTHYTSIKNESRESTLALGVRGRGRLCSITLAVTSVLLIVPSLMCLGCSEESKKSVLQPVDPWAIGPYPPAHTTVRIEDPDRERPLVAEIWYPGVDPVVDGESLLTFERSDEAREQLEQLLQLAPPDCPTRRTHSVRDGRSNSNLGPRPLIAFSHCYNCGRYSAFSLSERLASHGMIVMSVDHAGELPFVEGAIGETLSTAQLEVRVGDIRRLIGLALDGTLFAETELLRGLLVDSDKIGVFGHSFGSVTAGRVAQEDPRIRAVAGLAAPMENVLLPGVNMAEINTPLLFVLAEEDNSIYEFGNNFLRSNYDEANPPVWRVDIADAGHWSLSDLCGLTSTFSAGCGSGTRHSVGREGEAFDFIPVTRGIELTQRYLTAFFLAHLDDREDAFARLETALEDSGVSVRSRRE
jgi:dienelactone hydrolase